MSIDLENLKEKIFKSSIDIVIFDGWSDKTLFEAASINKISLADAKKMFPRGAIDLVKYYHEFEDKIFLAQFRKVDSIDLSHSKKIELALIKRFEIIVKNKEAFRRSMALFALPFYQIEGINLVFSTRHINTAMAETSFIRAKDFYSSNHCPAHNCVKYFTYSQYGFH